MKTTNVFKETVETGGAVNKSAKKKEAPVKTVDEPTENAGIIHKKIQHRLKETYNKLEKIDFNN